jgi:hypothetical protein
LAESPLTQKLRTGREWEIFTETGFILNRLTHSPSLPSGLKLLGAPVKMTVSQGQPVKLNCSVEGMEEPDIYWVKDGAVVQNSNQVYISVSEQHWIGFLRCRNVGKVWEASWGGYADIQRCVVLKFDNLWKLPEVGQADPSRSVPLDLGEQAWCLFPQLEVCGAL